MRQALHLICERDVGLFSLIQQVVAHVPWALDAGRVPIAFFEGRCCYWTPAGHADRTTVWEYYFEPLIASHPAEAIPVGTRAALAAAYPDPTSSGAWIDEHAFASSHYGDHPELEGKTLPIPYLWDDPNDAVRVRAGAIVREYVRPRAYVAEKVNAFFEQHLAGRRVIGVHVRGTDAVSAGETRAHRFGSLVLDNYVAAVEELLESMPDARILVATDAQSSLDHLTHAFGDRVSAYDSLRHVSGEAAGRGPGGWTMPAYISSDRERAARNGEEAVVEYLLLARCQHLVHNGSSLARTVLLGAPHMPHTNTHQPNRLTTRLRAFGHHAAGRALRAAKRYGVSPKSN